jgi:uroporphyrinogen-III synthase
MRVIITRPQAEAAPWLKALDAAGYTSWSLPLIDIRPSALSAHVESAWSRLSDFDAVMFVF